LEVQYSPVYPDKMYYNVVRNADFEAHLSTKIWDIKLKTFRTDAMSKVYLSVANRLGPPVV
jgi:hypothetical protein